MRTKTLLTTFIIALLLLCACSGDNQQQAGDLPVIDITRNHPRKEIRLQDIATIEYVLLETTDDIWLSEFSTLAHVSDRYIVVLKTMCGDIFVFNRNGKIISHFNHRGQEPREYSSFGRNSVVLDENAGEIFVLDSRTHRILVYSISGEYRRTLKLSVDSFVHVDEIHSFDNETLLLYDGARQDYVLVYNEKPYLLLSKQDGSIVYSFDITLPTRYTTFGGSEILYLTAAIPVPNNRHFGQDFVIADISSDTIFLLTQDRILTPLLTRRPSVHASEPRKVLTSLLKTDTFILLQKTTLDFATVTRGNVVRPLVLMYEFETGITSEVPFVDADWRSWFISFPPIGRNMHADLRFKDAQEINRLSSELKPFVAALDEEDNPVVRIVTFK